VRILHVITTIERGGAENQLLVLARFQRSENRDVSVFFLKGDNELEEEFRKIGAEVIGSYANHSLVRQLIFLRKYTRSKDLIVHAHLPRAELLCAFIKPRGVLVVSRHNAESFFPGSPRFISNLLSRFVSRRALHIIAISNAVSNYLYKSGEVAQKKHISVICYGYPTNEIHTQKRKKTYRVGTVSRLVAQKDLTTLLRGFQLAQNVNKEIVLEIIGEGSEKTNLQSLAKELGIENFVKFLGRTDKVDEAMQRWDLFILTSKYEGFGLVLLEAMSNKTPIIASDSEAAKEVLGQGFPFLFPIGDFVYLSQCILRLLSEDTENLLDYQSKRLREFSPIKMEKAIAELYLG